MIFRLNSRAPCNAVDLQADAGTVCYDLDMLLETAQRYADAQVRKDIVGMNMAVESFAIHCRAMIQFLFGHLESVERPGNPPERFPPPRPTDVFAWDYYRGWLYDCPTPTGVMGDSKWRADKHIAHITTDRRGVNQPGTGIESVWQLGAAVNEIGTTMALFLSKADSGNFDPVNLRRMKARIAAWTKGTVVPGVTFIAKSGPLDDPSPPIGFHAKTDVRTIPPGSSFNTHGKTE